MFANLDVLTNPQNEKGWSKFPSCKYKNKFFSNYLNHAQEPPPNDVLESTSYQCSNDKISKLSPSLSSLSIAAVLSKSLALLVQR